MIFERSTRVPWENKKSPVFKNWLSSNAAKTPEDWDQDFKQYVDTRIVNWRKRMESHKERSDQDIYEGYLRRLDLNEEYLKGKKILDLGCWKGSFVRTCLDQGIVQEVYGMDRELQGEALSEKYAGHFFDGDIRIEMPVTNVDLAVIKAALHMLLGESGIEETAKFLSKVLDVLSQSGEVRIGPITQKLIGKYPDDQREIVQMLEILSQNRNIKYEFIPVDISAWERKDTKERVVVFDTVLIIRNDE